MGFVVPQVVHLQPQVTADNMVKFEDPVAHLPFSTKSLELQKAKPRDKSSEFTDEENAMMTITGSVLVGT